MEETLNIDYHKKILVLKALNRTANIKAAATKLGVNERTVYNLKKEFNIFYNRHRREFQSGETIKI